MQSGQISDGFMRFLIGALTLAPASSIEKNSLAMKHRETASDTKRKEQETVNQQREEKQPITLFLCGDVMTGRGIDQVLRHPSSPEIYESYIKDARGYVQIAEKANGTIPKPVVDTYIWGFALEEFKRIQPDVKIINLETSVTRSNDYWKGKGINYRMHPKNIGCLTAAGIDYCSLANNHLLDWGYAGLSETLSTLDVANIKHAGAGLNLHEAEMPAVIDIKGKGRVIIFSYGMPYSGVPPSWAATPGRSGVNYLADLSDRSVQEIQKKVEQIKKAGDIIVFSVHWGGNWGYEIPEEHIRFARQLIDEAGIDVIHGHSSHHALGLEVYQRKPIIYGCGDFLNDYEGIGGHVSFRADLALMYFIKMKPSSGKFVELRMTPVQIKNFKLNKASKADAIGLKNTLDRESRQFGTRFTLDENNRLVVEWE